MGADPVVSVRLITYLQEGFIQQALDGILAQRTDFPIELVIGEDNGNDGTRQICETYSRSHPEVVRLLPLAPRRGMVVNHLETLKACRGEFVALCDGDDYWIDQEKLQLQVEVLREHSDCALSFHDAFAEYPDGRRERWLEGPYPEGYGAKELFEDWLITTSSIVFRNPRLQTFPRFMEIATHEDLALMVYLARQGRIDYLNRTMSVYRRHPGGVMDSSFKGAEFASRQIDFLQREIDCWSEGAYRRTIDRRIAGLMRSRALSWAREGRRVSAIREMGASLKTAVAPAGRVLWECARLGAEILGLGRLAAGWALHRRQRHRARERP